MDVKHCKRENVNAVFYEETYHPIKAGSIDGTDFVPHDIVVYRTYDPLGDPNLFGDSYSLAALSSPPAFLTNPSNTCFTRKVFMAFGWYGSSYEKALPRKNLRLGTMEIPTSSGVKCQHWWSICCFFTMPYCKLHSGTVSSRRKNMEVSFHHL